MKVMKQEIMKIFTYIKQLIVAVVLIISLITITRFFLFDVYYVPSESMDETIKPGELIFTNKLLYGSRWFNGNCITRLPGFNNVERNDIVVFNFPEGDTVYIDDPAQNYYLFKRRKMFGLKNASFFENREKCFLPIQHRIAYVKRCIALPGDSIKLIKGRVFVNKQVESLQCKRKFVVKGNREQVSTRLDLSNIKTYRPHRHKDSIMLVFAYPKDMDVWKKEHPSFNVRQAPWLSFIPNIFPCYPQKKINWRYDDYGPLYIPACGDTINITTGILPIYERLITVYENNKLELIDGDIVINNKPAHEYVVQQNYYFMMGDNRYSSIDSRSWGFVPEDHIIGKAQMILFSKDRDEKTRWERIGTMLK